MKETKCEELALGSRWGEPSDALIGVNQGGTSDSAARRLHHGKRMKPTLLIVEDAEELREIYELVLENEGYEVRSVGTAEDALALLRGWRPDLIVTDLFMPGMGGLELITRARSDLAPPVPVIVALSGFPDAKEEALRRGAVRFETKPLGAQGLLDVVAATLAGHSAPARDEEIERSRTTVRAVAEAALDAYLRRDPDLVARIGIGATSVSRYFGQVTAVVLFVRCGKLRVCVSTDASAYAPDTEANDLLYLANDVLESNARLLLPDLQKQTALRRAARGVRFFACVPFLVDNIAVGAACLLDNEPNDFSSSDLSILEHVAHASGTSLANPFAPHMMEPAGILGRRGFDEFLSNAVEWATRTGSAMGVIVVATEEPPPRGSLERVFSTLPGPRMGIGALDRRRLATFAMAETSSVVRERLSKTLHDLSERVAVRASAEVLVSNPVPRLAPDALVGWADDALVRTSEGAHTVITINVTERVEARG